MCTRKPRFGRKTTQFCCEVRYVLKFTAASHGSPHNSTTLVIIIIISIIELLIGSYVSIDRWYVAVARHTKLLYSTMKIGHIVCVMRAT